MSSDLDDLIRADDDLYEFNKPNPPQSDVKPITNMVDALDAFGGDEAKEAQPGAEISDEMENQKA
jgi:hypothetical protein